MQAALSNVSSLLLLLFDWLLHVMFGGLLQPVFDWLLQLMFEKFTNHINLGEILHSPSVSASIILGRLLCPLLI